MRRQDPQRPVLADLPYIAACAGAGSARAGERIQSLWSGYGSIVRILLTGGDRGSVVVKAVEPKAPRRRRRARALHARKCRSYEVEMAFYRDYAGRCDASCKVPELLGARTEDGRSLFVSNLDAAEYRAQLLALTGRDHALPGGGSRVSTPVSGRAPEASGRRGPTGTSRPGPTSSRPSTTPRCRRGLDSTASCGTARTARSSTVTPSWRTSASRTARWPPSTFSMRAAGRA